MSNSINIHVSHGSKVEDILLEDPDSTSIGDLKAIIHEKFGVPIEAQKLIFKGKTLRKEDELVSEAGIKNNSKIMLLGRKTDPAQDECLKKLDNISESTNTIERKIKKVEQELEGIEKVPSATETLVRGKRRTLVVHIQSLMVLTDKITDRIATASTK
ncbi:PREDICTED: BAG family molecular chaperone regulator 1-like isoform X2 [Amphimedon queenslandica]|uniref:Ubiquitin-like domain-containing protein n=1 Tax=Amphimedon queenslandica TaxID=400682 RepID=A0AAN0J6D0_AMPQE|nr:PREDICTED: BAG family molecular chaperone regulator 1-like isoform X2 [Amphimedon queenslandica]|eukprot:XP_019852243.1 PREDICTED: BAG family molecular chaperone regulator 1-like isoform X2 [Amphimedon queenslandica]